MSLPLYDAALRRVAAAVLQDDRVSAGGDRSAPYPDEPALALRFQDGRRLPLDVHRWAGAPDTADEALLARVRGPVLDVGCGPGRLGAALRSRGVEALGLDVSASAVQLARRRGGRAVLGDVFGAVPGAGRYAGVLLVDGNVGIGGDPVRLLARCRDLLAPGGRLHVEVGPPGSRSGSSTVRLETPAGERGSWFPWGWLTTTDVPRAAGAAGLSPVELWACEGRHFAELRVLP